MLQQNLLCGTHSPVQQQFCFVNLMDAIQLIVFYVLGRVLDAGRGNDKSLAD
jgi:hypothetical protein